MLIHGEGGLYHSRVWLVPATMPAVRMECGLIGAEMTSVVCKGGWEL